jgi:hypothetical protein
VYVKVWPFHTFSLYELSYYLNLKRYTIKLMEFNIQIHHNEIKKRNVFGKTKGKLVFFCKQKLTMSLAI